MLVSAITIAHGKQKFVMLNGCKFLGNLHALMIFSLALTQKWSIPSTNDDIHDYLSYLGCFTAGPFRVYFSRICFSWQNIPVSDMVSLQSSWVRRSSPTTRQQVTWNFDPKKGPRNLTMTSLQLSIGLAAFWHWGSNWNTFIQCQIACQTTKENDGHNIKYCINKIFLL